MSQLRVNVCARLPANHPFQPPMIEPLQSIPAGVEGVSEPAVPASSNLNESSSSHSKPTTQTSEPSVLDELVNHCSGELPGYETNQERASKVASDEVTFESPQQQAPNSQMASITCINIIIHPEQLPYHLNATHSNISFDTALKNLANKRSTFTEQSVSDSMTYQPEAHTLTNQHGSQTLIEQISEHDFMITSEDSDVEVEQTNFWVKPGFLSKSASSSSVVVSNSVPDQSSETITEVAIPEPSTTGLPSSSNLAIQDCAPTRTTNVLSPPTLFLDSTILADVCENIFQELNKLVQARNNLVHEDSYEK
jgi:hypothetical protein